MSQVVDVIVRRGGDEIDTLSKRPVRIMHSGHAGVVYAEVTTGWVWCSAGFVGGGPVFGGLWLVGFCLLAAGEGDGGAE